MKLVFRIVSYLEGISYLILLFVGVPMKRFAEDESIVKMFGMPHGILFIAYIILAFLIYKNQDWNNKSFFIVLLASIIPFGTFYVDRKLVK
jgi:integral membrane protein